jgi:hypothetical protein
MKARNWTGLPLTTEYVSHPKLRAICNCPLCERPKDQGTLVCWSCYRAHNMRNGNAALEAWLDQQEAKL